ncbi:MBL fold metallo-hydrolase [Streptomyces hoynatensis]|uniref:MBL fold metallo-hydrolase n=1 Tax=Streptomyces hoynatensis TaxID=1141874 RepID=A0A3A9YX74_9ACTN|nr:MBL fold metallo-hydrolase [Streptomyces hoynatensis]RKN40409.1 MBL fold metallo-hydrolase [Streptomyces hoynatensis]
MPTHEERLHLPATLRSLTLGDVRVSHVPDGAVQLSPRGWLPGSTAEVWEAHPEYLDNSGNLVGSLGGLLVERGDRALLIDTGFGPQSLRGTPGGPVGDIRGGSLLDSLARLGRKPEEIETVAYTHLHTDHIGWSWHPAPGSGRPAFAGARHVLSGPEWAGRESAAAWGTTPDMLDALAPLVRTVADGEEIFPGVTIRLTRGHTPGHAAYVLTAGDWRLIAFGDLVHSPIQFDHLDWAAAPDHDGGQGAAERHRLAAELAEPRTIGFGVHFADVPFGRVVRDGAGPTWRPVD